jgi:hypothetical protein
MAAGDRRVGPGVTGRLRPSLWCAFVRNSLRRQSSFCDEFSHRKSSGDGCGWTWKRGSRDGSRPGPAIALLKLNRGGTLPTEECRPALTAPRSPESVSTTTSLSPSLSAGALKARPVAYQTPCSPPCGGKLRGGSSPAELD